MRKDHEALMTFYAGWGHGQTENVLLRRLDLLSAFQDIACAPKYGLQAALSTLSSRLDSDPVLTPYVAVQALLDMRRDMTREAKAEVLLACREEKSDTSVPPGRSGWLSPVVSSSALLPVSASTPRRKEPRASAHQQTFPVASAEERTTVITVEAQTFLLGVYQSWQEVQSVTSHLPFLQWAKAREAQLAALITAQQSVDAWADAQKAVLSDPLLSTYFTFFQMTLIDVMTACKSVHSEWVSLGYTNKKDWLIQAVDLALDVVPLSAPAAAAIVGALQFVNDRPKQQSVNAMAVFCIHHTDWGHFVRRLAVLVCGVKQQTIADVGQEGGKANGHQPTTIVGFFTRVKEGTEAVVRKINASDLDTPVKRLADDDARRLYTAIMKERMKPLPSLEAQPLHLALQEAVYEVMEHKYTRQPWVDDSRSVSAPNSGEERVGDLDHRCKLVPSLGSRSVSSPVEPSPLPPPLRPRPRVAAANWRASSANGVAVGKETVAASPLLPSPASFLTPAITDALLSQQQLMQDELSAVRKQLDEERRLRQEQEQRLHMMEEVHKNKARAPPVGEVDAGNVAFATENEHLPHYQQQANMKSTAQQLHALQEGLLEVTRTQMVQGEDINRLERHLWDNGAPPPRPPSLSSGDRQKALQRHQSERSRRQVEGDDALPLRPPPLSSEDRKRAEKRLESEDKENRRQLFSKESAGTPSHVWNFK